MKWRHVLWIVILLAQAESAIGAEGELGIRPLGEGVFLHTSYRQLPDFGWFPSNGLILVSGDRAVLVDTAWTEEATREILAWLKQENLILDFVLVTHWHDDRTAGLKYLDELGIPTWASAETNAQLVEHRETPASHEFPDSGRIDQAWSLKVFHPGAGHTSDNHVVWLPEQRILFGGCFVKSAASRTLGNIADADTSAWGGSVQRVLAEFPGAVQVVPGHGEPGSLALLQHTLDLLEKHNAVNTNTAE